MKTVSAWNWDRLDYTHYECPGHQSAGGWGAVDPSLGPKPPPKNKVGVDIEALLSPLPSGCRKVGTGRYAKGQIVRPIKRAFTGFGESGTAAPDSSLWPGYRVLGAIGVGVVVVYAVRLIEDSLGRR
jgi:hypothetical protein